MIETRTFRAIATTVVPEAAELTQEEWREFFAVINAALARRPAAMRRQLGLFIRILGALAMLHYHRSLSSLGLDQRTAFLHKIENSKLRLFRRGFWGVRTLVLMGYYARPSVSTALGYTAAPRGWELRR